MLLQIGTLPLLPARTWRGNRWKEFQRRWWMGDSCESDEWELGFLQPKQTPGTTRWPPWLRQTTGVVGNTWRKQTFTESSSVRTWHETTVGGTKKGAKITNAFTKQLDVSHSSVTVSWWMSRRDSEHTTQWVELNLLNVLCTHWQWFEFFLHTIIIFGHLNILLYWNDTV